MKIFSTTHLKNIMLTLAVSLFGIFAVAQPAPVGALFEGAKDEACKGANLSNSDTDCKSGEATSKLDKTVQNIVNIITVIVGIIAVIMIIINGLKFITSNGDSNNVSSAKNGIIYAIVGLIIVALAQVIVRFVLDRI